MMDDARALGRADASERCVTAVVSGSADGRRRLAGLVREDLRRIHAHYMNARLIHDQTLTGCSGSLMGCTQN